MMPPQLRHNIHTDEALRQQADMMTASYQHALMSGTSLRRKSVLVVTLEARHSWLYPFHPQPTQLSTYPVYLSLHIYVQVT